MGHPDVDLEVDVDLDLSSSTDNSPSANPESNNIVEQGSDSPNTVELKEGQDPAPDPELEAAFVALESPGSEPPP